MFETTKDPTEILTIGPSASVKAAAIKMINNRVGCLIVNNDNGEFEGLVTERDIVSRLAAFPIDLERTTVAQIMTTHVISCSPDTQTSKARQIMTANRIRHLPIVDNEVVVGIFSIRDLMAQQLLEDRAAAEEVAMLSTCLRSIDLNEVANIVTTEVPKLFQAKKCVLFFHRDSSATKGPMLVNYNKCCCPEKSLGRLRDSPRLSDESGTHYDSVPQVCEKLGAQPPHLAIPLDISGLKEASSDRNERLSGYLCMCGLAPSIATNRELTSHKAKLAREILNSHLTNARLYQQARLTSLTDALTEVGSRRLFEDKLQAECARSKRYKRPLSVAIIDLDNFKTINDMLGHAAGDDALRKLAACMKSQKRVPDVLARLGGDEFVIIMPETKAKDALPLLERLRAKARQVKIAKNLSITISCGVAQISPEDNNPASELTRRADLALHEAKNAGRDCVKTWDESMSNLLNASDIEIEKIRTLQMRVAGLSEQSETMFIQSIWGLVQALEAKDAYAKKHSENVMHYAVGIAETMEIAPKQIEVIRRAAMLHDIGKIGIPDAILSKPGRLTARERSIIEQHPLIAVGILDKMTFLEMEMSIVRHHHERWNGQGYPDGLSNTSIPFGARIIAVADTFDAITSNRPYHNSRSLAEAMEILVDSSEYEFDPQVIKGMVCWIEEIRDRLGKVGQLTPEDLLDSQKHLDRGSMAPAAAGAADK